MTKEKATFSVQLPAEIADEIKREADRELISAAAVVRRIIAEHVRQNEKQEVVK
jgi:hypothetical protein